ncbi:MAG: FAD-dependent oxidoreductase [Synechococcaceae cyanobacterium]|nr:FAD-dependent oxidoreductase [Synechococcaceae cyanobacterium]
MAGEQIREQPTTPKSEAAAAGHAGIVIAGGGFGGLYTALALAALRDPPPILLIEPHDQFVFLPLLYELLSEELRRWEVAPRYDTLLAGLGIGWLQDRVVKVEASCSQLRTAAGRTIAYSRLVLATGASGNTFGVPGADRHSLGFRSLADVDRLRALIRELRRNQHPLQRLAVVGAGPTGVELACKLADLLQGAALIELIEQGSVPLPASRSFHREQAELALRRRDVRLRCHTRVAAVGSDSISLMPPQASPPQSGPPGIPDGEERLTVQGVIWTAGLRFQPPAIDPEPAPGPLGRLRCEPDLRLSGHDRIFVAGDLALLSGDGDEPPPPTTAQVAFQQAPLLAANLIRSLASEPLQPFVWNDLGELMSLGIGEASLTAAGLNLAGKAAFQLRRITYLTRLPGRPHQLRVAAGWLADAMP